MRRRGAEIDGSHIGGSDIVVDVGLLHTDWHHDWMVPAENDGDVKVPRISLIITRGTYMKIQRNKTSHYVADARLFGVIKQKVFHFHFRLRRCVSNHTLNIGPMRNENNNSNASLIDRECLPRLHLICNTPQDMIGIMNSGGFTISLAEYDRSDSLSSLDTWGCQDYFIHVRFLLFH